MNENNVGKFIALLRRSKKMNQKQFAIKVGVVRQTVSNWELGITIPDDEHLERISKLFDVSIEEILNGKRNSDWIKISTKEDRIVENDNYGKNNIVKTRDYKWIMYIVIVLLVVFTIFYIVYRKNCVYYTSIEGSSDYINITDGYFIHKQDNLYFYLGKVNSKKNIKNLMLYYKNNDNINKIYYCNDCSTTEVILFDSESVEKYFDFFNLKIILANLYLNVTYEDNLSETIKIINKENKLDDNVTDGISLSISYKENISDIVYTIENTFDINDDGYNKIYEYDGKKIQINYLDSIINISVNSNYKVFEYNVNTSILDYKKFDNGELIVNESFIINSTCFDNCDIKQNIIDEFSSILSII